MTEEQIREQRNIDYQTLGRFLGIAEMAMDNLITRDAAFTRIIEIRAEYSELRAKSGCLVAGEKRSA